ncbi:Ger(x)C family spore germination protein [Cohnella fermenti]|uniref:Ger(X)C family spore germination protein n=1 Tax=Cohnella fermenti TaxID=2565925 RepID=A0A4S4BTZ7_9BACL|nr:Ger(x)C family spore germination protein [Cohnella fermenti]THF76367.1 Ger(x)C family spore germination protein [Cohnella fermenti]
MAIRRTLLRLAVIGLMPMLLAGCWSRLEVNDRLFVSVMYVDAGADEGEVKLTLGFALPNRMTSIQQGIAGGGGNPYGTMSNTGPSIAVAFRRIQANIPRQINWGHTRVVVIGDKLARQGIRPVLEFITRQPAMQLKGFIFIAQGEAHRLSMVTPIMERFPSEILRELAAQKSIMNTTARDLLMSEPFEGDGLIGRISVDEVRLISEKGKKGLTLNNIGTGILRNEKLVGYLSASEQRGAMWVKDQMENALVTIQSPTDGQSIDLYVNQASTRIKLKQEGERVRIRISVRATDDVYSSNSALDFQDPQQIRQIQQALNEQLKERIERALERSQQLGADYFQFGSYMEWYLPSLWKQWKMDWRRHYEEDVIFEVVPEAKVARTGAIRSSYWKPITPEEGKEQR